MNPTDTLTPGRAHQSAQYGGKLSPREIQCLELAACGLQAKEIARCLGITYATVKNHLLDGRIKLGARNAAHAVALLYERKVT